MAKPRGEFAGVLRELRTRARLTQEGLAAAAGLSHRTVSDLERGLVTTPQKDTVRLLADALDLIGPERARFETAARGRPLEVASRAASAAAMRSLPRDVPSFTGRAHELDQLAKAAITAGGVVSIHAIGGMAGVGKTAFAVHAAHQLADRFSGGQVFLPLHGHTRGQAPVDPADALASLLLAIGVPADQVPPELEARAALWRDRLAGHPLLLVLDDAAGSQQVRPLLPGSGGSLVLVTSRQHLSALDDSTAISLDTLPPDEAAALLVQLAGRPGLHPGDPGVREITRLCGYLPLAIGMMARQLRHHPAWSAAGRAAELTSAQARLALMETENLSVAAAFDLSYANLSGDQQRLFRRIGLHPGTQIDAYAAAALDGTSLPAARRGLEALYDQYLLAEPGQGRYQPHDLIREYARTLADRFDPDADQDDATSRLLDYYQHTAAIVNTRLTTRTRSGRVMNGAVPAAVPVLAHQEQALSWARTERASLLACLDHAAATGQLTRVAALTAGICGLLLRDGPWTDGVARATAAVQATRQLGDPLSHADALGDLGYALRQADDYPAAARAQEQALSIYRELGDQAGQATALCARGFLFQQTGDYPAAARAQEEGLSIYRELGDQAGQANALGYLGMVLYLTGDFPAATRALEESLALYRELGDRPNQARTLSRLGIARQLTGDFPAATRALEESLALHRAIGPPFALADSLTAVGDLRRLTGDYRAAAEAVEEALAIFRDLADLLGQGIALLRLGSVRQLTGDYPAAARALEESLSLYRDIGDQGAVVEVLNERGTLHRVSGELALARECHQQSLDLSREIGGSWDEAHALAGLGRCARADGDAGQGAAFLRQALEIFQRIGAAEVTSLLAELDAVGEPTD